jgi:coenzyme F420-reducing hydrogenase delta subunit
MAFEPNIVGFLCNWCSYAGADLAGVSRIQYPTNIRVIRVMCSGRVDPAVVLGLLTEGADGVMITGCHIGDCHYIDGNLHARRKYGLTRRLAVRAGLEPGRLRLEWVSAAEGQRFADLVNEFTEQVRELGPSPLSGDDPDPTLLLNMRAAKAAAEGFRLRALVGKEEKTVTVGNVYGEAVSQEEWDRVMAESVDAEFSRHRIHLALMENPGSVIEVSERLGMEAQRVLEHVVVLRQLGWVDVKEIRGSSPIYVAMEVPQ